MEGKNPTLGNIVLDGQNGEKPNISGKHRKSKGKPRET